MKQEEDLARLTETFCVPNYRPLPVIVSRGRGVWVWDVYGKRYLDMSSCYSVLNFGHRHPRIEKAFIRQVKRLGVFSRAFHNDQLGPFSKELADLCGQEVAIAPKVLPMNTGVEAVETTIKAARRWGYQVKHVEEEKAEIIVCDNNFHGRTTTVIGFSSYEKKPITVVVLP